MTIIFLLSYYYFTFCKPTIIYYLDRLSITKTCRQTKSVVIIINIITVNIIFLNGGDIHVRLLDFFQYIHLVEKCQQQYDRDDKQIKQQILPTKKNYQSNNSCSRCD